MHVEGTEYEGGTFAVIVNFQVETIDLAIVSGLVRPDGTWQIADLPSFVIGILFNTIMTSLGSRKQLCVPVCCLNQ